MIRHKSHDTPSSHASHGNILAVHELGESCGVYGEQGSVDFWIPYEVIKCSNGADSCGTVKQTASWHGMTARAMSDNTRKYIAHVYLTQPAM
jgi:hypothetical protein